MNKVAIVTGASRGIGKEIAYKLAGEGYILALCAFERMDLLEKVKLDLEEKQSEVRIYQLDVANENSVKEMISDIKKRYHSIDLLVNNAGISIYKQINDTSYSDFDRIVKTNLYGVFNCSKECVDMMISQKSGCIINISSIWGEIGASMETAYSLTKGGVIAFTKALAKELAPSNVRVNAITPAGVDTDMLNVIPREQLQAYVDELPIKRLAKPQEIANIVSFLASKDAEYISGSIIRVDGASY